MAQELGELFRKVAERGWPLVVEAEDKFLAVGDLHGDIKTLEKILKEWPPPYLFLGDYVDRGDHGVEVVRLVLQLALEGKAIALRGNHESPMMFNDGGFLDELCNKFGSKCGELARRAAAAFAKLPLAAVVNKKIVALHGGIPFRDDMTPATLQDLANIKGDLEIPTDPLAFQVLWNDPCTCEDYAPSPRGFGAWLFGHNSTRKFHKTHGTATIVRGHTYVQWGCARHHDGGVLTVFTSTAGPYKKVRPKVALIEKEAATPYDLESKNEAKCLEDVEPF